jgi:hypothetical protein
VNFRNGSSSFFLIVSTAGVSHPAVFDSVIIAGRNPAILFNPG